MANPEHVKLLLQGVETFYQLQREDPKAAKDQNRIGELFVDAIQNWNKRRRWTTNREADLSNIDLRGPNATGLFLLEADLRSVDLSNSNLSGALLMKADLGHAKLINTDLSNASLSNADLFFADLSGACLRNADLMNTSFLGATLKGTDFTKAEMGWTIFSGTDLSEAIGLENMSYIGPGFIDFETIRRSGGRIPESFLHDCGVPDVFITFARSLVSKAIDFYSCFISYSANDEEFAKRLHSRMREEGLRVWFAPEDMKGGQKLHEQIERAIQVHDRLLIVLSEHSLQSEWVMTELRNARKVEVKEKRRKLFPIRLVDFDAIKTWTCFDAETGKDLAVEVREYFIPDFTNWKDHDAFETAFARLLRDLKAEEKA